MLIIQAGVSLKKLVTQMSVPCSWVWRRILACAMEGLGVGPAAGTTTSRLFFLGTGAVDVPGTPGVGTAWCCSHNLRASRSSSSVNSMLDRQDQQSAIINHNRMDMGASQ